MNQSHSTAENKYILGKKIEGYQGYCPIVSIPVFEQDSGTYLHSETNTEFNETDFIERPGFLLIQLGAIEEDYTLETAANAVFWSLQSLFSACDIPVNIERMRTTIELSEYLKQYRSRYSHIILIGHGSEEGISFLDKKDPLGGIELSGLLGADKSDNPIQIISLCCHSGCEQLSKALSSGLNVNEVIAPKEVFDIRWAVHFITSYFLFLFINELDTENAVKNAASNDSKFCIWKKGELVGECGS